MKNPKNQDSSSDSSSFDADKLSTDLCLLDPTWPFPEQSYKPKPSLVSLPDLSHLRILSDRERERERAQSVSTELTLFWDPWKIKKRLTRSDIGNQSRLLLLTQSVQTHILPYLKAREVDLITQGAEMDVTMFDVDTGITHRLRFKMWVTKSHVLVGNWRKEIVKPRGLEEGDKIGLYWDQSSSRLFFSVLSRANA